MCFVLFKGEDALANLSIEKADGVLQGHVRIRSKTQGIALSLGDKITLLQRFVCFHSSSVHINDD